MDICLSKNISVLRSNDHTKIELIKDICLDKIILKISIPSLRISGSSKAHRIFMLSSFNKIKKNKNLFKSYQINEFMFTIVC